MDMVVLKKKLSTYLTDKGYLKNVSEDVLFGVIVAWENWTGTSTEFCRSLGLSGKQLSPLIGKAKKLKREGYYAGGDFKQVKIEGSQTSGPSDTAPCTGIEVTWHGGSVIRFFQVDLLVDFLKKVA